MKDIKIHLRPSTVDDTDLILKWRNDENLKKYFFTQKDISREEHLKWFQDKVMTGKVVQFIIVDSDTDKPIGSTNIQGIDDVNHNAEFGIFLDPNGMTGKGIGTMAAKATVQYAFTELGLHKVYLRVLADNLRAIRCYEKAGFIREGLLLDEVFIHGEYNDIIQMSIINKKN